MIIETSFKKTSIHLEQGDSLYELYKALGKMPSGSDIKSYPGYLIVTHPQDDS
jgi:hypothetical protein